MFKQTALSFNDLVARRIMFQGLLWLLRLSYFHVIAFENERLGEEPWDLDGPCQPYIQRFGDTAANMVRCAASFSSPPKVCTTCVSEFIAFKQSEYELHRLTNVSSLDNTSCSQVIFSNYLVSYISELSIVVSRRIWDQSRCDSCVNISWKLEENATMYAFTKNVYNFEDRLLRWRHCVMNYSLDGSLLDMNYSTICENCLPLFNSLFHFYWDVYVTPGIDFCLDVETTMNDTMNVWHNVWGCADDRGHHRERDWTFVIFSVVILTTLTFLFYLGSYVRSERANRTLVQYSRLGAPGGVRSRILSSSALADEFVEQQGSSSVQGTSNVLTASTAEDRS
ncbi:Uncharacterized protein F42A8.3 [Toxocara canis]|uniref:Uncharacterized protein F42A8.3 n=1 Tax=Toxocara canis TaxID=6265 RepID=A0A0B2W4H8_TOXCA|nr:Uncharacterized protein F42A8.3 [Toxocara canis]